MREKIAEIINELRQLLENSPPLGDILIPPLLFLFIFFIWDLRTAVILTGAGILLLVAVRLWRRQSLRAAGGGLLGLLVAAIIVYLLEDETSFFLPAIFSSGGTFLLALASILGKRPLVAWTSHLARRWPRAWYWHPQVRPAYTEVTWLWAGYFLLRMVLQLILLSRSELTALTTANFFLGWPATLLLLIGSYIFGSWRLKQLAGPSVSEFQQRKPAPWESQQHGF